MTQLEKRLTADMNLGIYITHEDGHRWIRCNYGCYDYDFNEELRKHGISLNSKVYGTVSDALDTVDVCLEKMGEKMLIDKTAFDEIEVVDSWYAPAEPMRIKFVEKGKGGLN